MSKCTISGCRNLQTVCNDCGRVVCTATFKSPNEWINVKDRLPEKDQKVIFYVLDRELIYAGYFSIDNHRSLSSGERFRENLDDWWFDEETITHWMPLPKPPEEK